MSPRRARADAGPSPDAAGRFRSIRHPAKGVHDEVFSWDGIDVGHFRCAPDSPQWTRDNQVGPAPLIVVPRRLVRIDQAGAAPVVAGPAQFVLYRGAQLYRRRLIDPRGDDCHYVRLPRADWAELIDDDPDALPCNRGPLDLELHREFQRLAADLWQGAVVERLELEDRLFAMLDRMLADALVAHAQRRELTPASRELAGAAEEFLACQYRDNWSLAQLARELGSSPAHLSRCFRSQVGVTLHQQRIRLRLAEAIELVGDGELSLTRIAHELGFASSAHFSDQFRRHFGVPPSALRGCGRRERLARIRRAQI